MSSSGRSAPAGRAGRRPRAREVDPRLPSTAAVLDALTVLADGLVPDGADPADPSAAPAAALAEVRGELLAVAYRLLLGRLASAAGVEVAPALAVTSLAPRRLRLTGPAPDRVAAVLAAAADLLPVDPGWVGLDLASPGGLGRLHEELHGWWPVRADDGWTWHAAGRGRKAAGAYFTPPALVDHLLDLTLDPLLGSRGVEGRVPTVLDPACGAGAFLLPAVRRLVAWLRGLGVPAEEARAHALASVHGVDSDPAVLELARVALWLDVLTAPGGTGGPGGSGGDRGARPSTPADLLVPLPLAAGDAVAGLDWVGTFPDVFVDAGFGAGEFEVGEFAVGDFEAGSFEAGGFERGGFDVVVGNPPFANQLERLTARPRAGRSGGSGASAPYTDLSALFLLQGLGWVAPGGRLGLVQPQSVLSARDAAPVRRALVDAGALVSLWTGDPGVFDAAVPTCALVVEVGAAQRQGAVERWHGPAVRPLPPVAVDDVDLSHEWGFLAVSAEQVPLARLSGTGVLGDLASCTADFRDQYYGLAPYVGEAGTLDGRPTAPLVTAGLIDPATCRWGRRATRFLKQRWAAPEIDLAALAEHPTLGPWARRRLVPKVLLATQGRVLEAVVDRDGAWLPSVPVVTVQPHDPADLWRVAAVLLAPPVCAAAARRYAGSALHPGAIKLSAAQAAELTLPVDLAAWEAGADEVRAAHDAADAADDEARHAALLRAGAHLCTAYGFSGAEADELLAWWAGRLPRAR